MPIKKYKTKEQADAARIASVAKSVKEHYVSYAIRLNKETEKEIIDKLSTIPGKTEYFRNLILADMAKGEQQDAFLEAVSRLTSEQRQALLNFIQTMQK